MEKAASRPLAFFDFDGTMIKGDSIVAFLKFAKHLKALSGKEYARVLFVVCKYLLGKCTDEQSKNAALRFLKTLSPERKYALERAFAEEILLPRVYPEARAAIEKHKQEGAAVVMVSASTENYLQFIAPALGFDALLCTSIQENGEIGPNCKGEEKVKRIQEWLKEQDFTPDFAASHAYGDSKSDLPMIALCGKGTLINAPTSVRKAAPHLPVLAWGKK